MIIKSITEKFNLLEESLEKNVKEVRDDIEDLSEAVEVTTDHLKEVKTELKELGSSVLKKEDIDRLKPQDGKTPTTSELLDLIEPLIPEPVAGPAGKDGEPGSAGKDGTEIEPKIIKEKLESLKGSERVNLNSILGFETLTTRKDLDHAVSTLQNQTRFLINNVQASSSSSSGVSSLNSLTGDLDIVAGSGINVTESGTDITISAIGANVDNSATVSVKVATTAALPASTYNNGASGVGATLTRNTNGNTGAIDGVAVASLVAGDRILVKNQAAALQNGIYQITQQGTASLPFILTRTTDADQTAELDDLVAVASLGTTNKGIPYGQQTNNPTVGTNNIVWTATGIFLRQQTSGTQAINQIPIYTATALTQTKGTSAFKYNPTTNVFTINSIDYTFPSDNGDANEVLTTNGSGTLTWSPSVLTGTAQHVPYFDLSGNVTSDAQFTRNASTQVTNIRAGSGTSNTIVSLTSTLSKITKNNSDGSSSYVQVASGGASLFYGNGSTINNSISAASGSTSMVYSNTGLGADSTIIQLTYQDFRYIWGGGPNDYFSFPASSRGNANEFLKTNGDGTTEWDVVTITPAGADTQVQYNDAGTLGADSNFVWNKTSYIFQVGDLASSANDTTISLDDTASSIVINSLSTSLGNISGAGNGTKILIVDSTQSITLTNVPAYADDAAATGAGLTTGMLYRTTTGGSTFLKIVP